MTKTFCDMCGKELSPGNCRTINMEISPRFIYGKIKLDYCENCFNEILCEYSKLKEREADNQKKRKGVVQNESLSL